MIVKAILFIAPLFLLDLAGKCDTYVRGTVWIHNIAGDEAQNYEGCKKGCFDNGTVSENGVVKCEKCSAIEDQQLCEDHSDTCFWTKGNKCRSTSCPEMVTNLGKAGGRARALKECLEGDEQTKFYNDLSWNEDPPRCDYSTPACQKKLCDWRYDDAHYAVQLAYYLSTGTDWAKNFYGSAQAAADSWRASGLQTCLDTYEGQKSTCVNNYGYRMPQRNHIATKAARKTCHVVYGCMYSADNSRCSYWAVWAFVVTLVVCIVVVVAVVLGVILFVFKDKIKSAAP